MSPKTGRPKLDNARKTMLRIRMNDDDLEKLDFCCNAENQSRSELIRNLIFEHYNRLQK